MAAAARSPRQPAVISSVYGVTSYAALAESVSQLIQPGSELARLKLGSVVACTVRPPAKLLALLYACSSLGLVISPLEPRLKPAERATLLGVMEPRLLVDETGFDAMWPPTLEDPKRAAGPPPVDEQTLFYLGFTSGSTGMPKGLLRTQVSWALSFESMTRAFEIGADATVLVGGGLASSFFLTAALQALSVGARTICLDKFDARRIAQLAIRQEASVLYVVPTMARRLAVHLEQAHCPIPSLRTIIAAGARWVEEDMQRLQAVLPDVTLLEYYGSSEMGFVSLSRLEPTPRRGLGSVGQPFPGVQVSIRDLSGAEVGPGVEGLIGVRSPMTFARYVSEPATTPARSQTLAWVSSGDRGYRDRDGFLHLRGREDEQINVGGAKVMAAEIEQLLLSHPAVADAVVVGLPDSELGQVVGAVVELHSAGGEKPLPAAAELRTWLRARCSTHKVPRKLLLVPRLPLTPGGKPARAVAREWLTTGSADGA